MLRHYNHVIIVSLLAVIAAVASALTIERPTPRIYNGQAILISKIPYQVGLEIARKFSYGGSLIGERFVLTAAHCVQGVNASELNVRVGTSFAGEGGIDIQASRIIMHEDYSPVGDNNSNNVVHDIALIELEYPVHASVFTEPIQMFEAGEEIRPNANGIVSGWGLTETGVMAGQLRSAIVPIVGKSECNSMFSGWGGIAEGQICAGALGPGGRDACSGDSGGPLAVDGRLAGIVSYGVTCGKSPKYYPGVYTEVAYYRDWIRKQTGL